MNIFWQTVFVLLLLNRFGRGNNGIRVFSLSGFGDCVIHLTRFRGTTKVRDLVQNFFAANPNSIWTFTNTTYAETPIQPEIKVNELCSINILLNSESIEFAPSSFIWNSIYSRRDNHHSNFVIVRQNGADLGTGIGDELRYLPVRIFCLVLPNKFKIDFQWIYFCPPVSYTHLTLP